MKVVYSKKINAFGGLNFVHQELEHLRIGHFLNQSFPSLSAQSKYDWKDVFYSFLSIFYTGGEVIEDAHTILARQLDFSPWFKLCSPDTIIRRFKHLVHSDNYCKTKRGEVQHHLNFNPILSSLNLKLLKKLGVFNKEVILDYDNTIIYTEKEDAKMTYKRNYGYQPGVCFVNNQYPLYIENRNGNSDAKAFQTQTLQRMFDLLTTQKIKRIDKIRMDAASYQFDVIELVEQKVDHFYIGARNSYVDKYFHRITNWKETIDSIGEVIEVGSINFTPFTRYYKAGTAPKEYRLLVKRKKNHTGQINILTQDDYEYRAVVSNDFKCNAEQGLKFYYKRGKVEKEFDILKNDFGWAKPPFSQLGQNTVFLYFSAICRNLYNVIIRRLALKTKLVKINFRMKRLIFSFISVPAKWFRQSKKWKLRVYGIPPDR
jgi:hypothetical protein